MEQVVQQALAALRRLGAVLCDVLPPRELVDVAGAVVQALAERVAGARPCRQASNALGMSLPVLADVVGAVVQALVERRNCNSGQVWDASVVADAAWGSWWWCVS